MEIPLVVYSWRFLFALVGKQNGRCLKIGYNFLFYKHLSTPQKWTGHLKLIAIAFWYVPLYETLFFQIRHKSIYSIKLKSYIFCLIVLAHMELFRLAKERWLFVTLVDRNHWSHGLTLIPSWMSNYIHYKMWDEITYSFLNFNGCIVEV